MKIAARVLDDTQQVSRHEQELRHAGNGDHLRMHRD